MIAQTVHPLTSMLAAWHSPLASGNYTVTVFAISTGVIGLACCYWAAWMHARLANYRLSASCEHARQEAAIRLRDGLLAGGREGVAVLGTRSAEPYSVGGGDHLLQAGMDGPDAVALAAALETLQSDGMAFELGARTTGGGAIAMRGTTIGPRAAVYLRDLGLDIPVADYHAALDSLPAPVWIRGRDLGLRWANRAFLAATGKSGLADAFAANAAIEHCEPDLAAVARDGVDVIDARRYASVAGERRALSLNLTRLPDASVAGIAFDVTEAARAEARLQLNADATADMLDRMPEAIAIFGRDQRLLSHNTAYARMWNFDADWLRSGPTKADILDRLRESHSLPEQRDFAAWKNSYLQLFQDCAKPVEEFRHLADGRSIRVVAQPHLLGGLFFLFEDVSERLRLEASFKLLAQVQRATLDTVESSIAIFGPDGRLVLHNRAFAKLWRLGEEELSGSPHLNRLAVLAQSRTGQDSIWSIVAAGVTSEEPERCAEWGKAARADGKLISVSMSRLPNGATVVTFSDLSELSRFQFENERTTLAAA